MAVIKLRFASLVVKKLGLVIVYGHKWILRKMYLTALMALKFYNRASIFDS